MTHTEYDLMELWKILPKIPRNHDFKGIPLEVLDDLGWRWDVSGHEGMGPGYFIPYFDHTRSHVPFAQMRHAATSDRRFTFLPGAQQTVYGKWNLVQSGTEKHRQKFFVVEGTSDCAVMQHCMIPWIGLPSASSGAIMTELAKFCRANSIELIYAGDNDAAGDKLKEALDAVMPYRTWQAPKMFKDWGEFLEATSREKVSEYCLPELFA